MTKPAAAVLLILGAEFGLLVPMPTFPVDVIRIFSELLVPEAVKKVIAESRTLAVKFCSATVQIPELLT